MGFTRPKTLICICYTLFNSACRGTIEVGQGSTACGNWHLRAHQRVSYPNAITEDRHVGQLSHICALVSLKGLVSLE